ncbi:MAG: SGNH/GDSL hydrolase family protein [Ginsengibacter sp.]
MKPLKKKRIVFFGDSITEAGVKKGGYIDLIQSSLNEKGMAENYALFGAGIGGNKVYDLYLRLEDDVLSKKPDVVFIYVGINDVWHKTSGTGTDLDKYEKFYNALITKIEAAGAKVVVCTPTVIGELKNDENAQDKDLNAYADVVRKIATARNCKLVDLRKDFTDYIDKNNPQNLEQDILTTDRVHLNQKGNQVVADAMLEKI